MKILAVDPGYDRIGFAILDGSPTSPFLLHSECFITDRKKTREKRLSAVAEKTAKIISVFEPDEMAIETLFFSANQKTAIGVAEARGVILSEAGRLNLNVREINPNSVKVAVTGYGKSDKKSVMMMVDRLVKIKKKPEFDDEYDAIAIGLTALATNKTKKTA